MFKIKQTLIFVMLCQYIMVYSSIDSSLITVQNKYEDALEKLINVYQNTTPPKQIQFQQSDLVGATYDKIIYPYVLELKGYANVVMSAYTRKFSVLKNLQILQQKFQNYETKVTTLSKKFPQKDQPYAMTYFYMQLTESVVQNCAKIVQDISYRLSTNQQDLDTAHVAYELAWATQVSNMKINDFANVDQFRTDMTKWMINLYQSAIAYMTANLQKTDNRETIYNTIASYHEIMAQVLKNNGEQQQAAVEQQNAQDQKQLGIDFAQAKKDMEQASTLLKQARGEIIIDFANPSNTHKSIESSVEKLVKSQSLYNKALGTFTKVQDENSVTRCQANLNEISADQHIRGIQTLWILFLQDDYTYGQASATKAFEAITTFYQTNVVQDTIDIAAIELALLQVKDMCTQVPNTIHTKLAIMPLLQNAINMYKSAGSIHIKGQNQDRLANIQMLTQLQDFFTHFVSLLKGMISFSKTTVVDELSSIVLQMIVDAQSIDQLVLPSNSFLQDFTVNFTDFEKNLPFSKRSYISFVVQYMYRIVIAKNVQKTETIDSKAALQMLSYAMLLQNYTQYLMPDQIEEIQKIIIQRAQDSNLVKQIKTQLLQAQQNTSWVNESQQNTMYQSVAYTDWNNAVYLYELANKIIDIPGISLSGLGSKKTLEKKYLQVLQQYIANFIDKVPKFVGHQLYMVVPLYKLYFIAKQQGDVKNVTYVLTTLQALFGKTDSFFTDITKIAESATDDRLTEQEQVAAQNNISTVLSYIQTLDVQQQIARNYIMHFIKKSKQPKFLLESTITQDKVTLRIDIERDDYMVEIVNPLALKMNALQKKISAIITEVDQALTKRDFLKVKDFYKVLQADYLSLYQLATDSSDQESYKKKYFLSQTRYMAATLAATVTTSGSVTFDTMTNIPQKYYADNVYIRNITMKDLASAVPDELQKYTEMTNVADEATQSMVQNILQAYIISKILEQQGLNFVDYYQDYQLTKKDNIAQSEQEAVNFVQQSVMTYIQEFKQVSYAVLLSNNLLTIVVKNMPVPAINPMYANGPYAGMYFSGAAQLFKSGTKLITVGGTLYVPGQDDASAQLMWQDLSYAYVSQATTLLQEGQSDGTNLITMVKNQVKDNKTVDNKAFMKQFNIVKQKFVRAQALLAPGGAGAYQYFQQAKQPEKMDSVNQMYTNSYKTQIELFTQLLIGDPIANYYNAALSNINQAYITWNASLDSKKDAQQIEQNQEAIVTLYKTAAASCMDYSYTSSTFPFMQQYHYMTAAANYLSAKQAYQLRKDATNAAAMNDLAMKAYFLACTQNIMLYYGVKEHGITYTPMQILGQSAQTAQTVTYDQLQQRYQSFENDGNYPSIVSPYNKVKDLLIGASMFYQLVGNHYGKQGNEPQTTNNSSDTITQQAKQETSNIKLNPKIVTFLHDNNIIDKSLSEIPYTKAGILKQLFMLANKGFTKFINEPAVLASWCNALNMAIAYQYIYDYEGGLSLSGADSDKTSEFEQKWESFFDAVQKKEAALQNPSSAYIG